MSLVETIPLSDFSSAGNSYLLYTDGMSFDESTWVTPRTNIFYLDVVACQDARMALLTDRNDKDNGYEILFGGFDNTGAALYNGVLVCRIHPG